MIVILIPGKMVGGPMDGEPYSFEIKRDQFEFSARDILTIFEESGPGRIIPGPKQGGCYVRDPENSDVWRWTPA